MGLRGRVHENLKMKSKARKSKVEKRQVWHGLQREIKMVEEERNGTEILAPHAVAADVGLEQGEGKWRGCASSAEVCRRPWDGGCHRRRSQPLAQWFLI